MPIVPGAVTCPPKMHMTHWGGGARDTHHLYGRMAEVRVRHGGVVALHHVNPFPRQGLDDRLVSL